MPILTTTQPLALIDTKSHDPDRFRPELAPGCYRVERVKSLTNTSKKAGPWLVLPGTVIGCSELWIRRQPGVTISESDNDGRPPEVR